jgi:choline-sulfatase
VPFLASWPSVLKAGTTSDALVALTDLFGIATAAAGAPEYRDGHPVLGVLSGKAAPRDYLFACYGNPGTPLFKAMIRKGDLKYIYLSNGGREQLFNLKDDPHELQNLNDPAAKAEMKAILAAHCARDGLFEALSEDGAMRAFEYKLRPLFRIHQFDTSSGIRDFTFKESD